MHNLSGFLFSRGWGAAATALSPALIPYLDLRARRGKEVAERVGERRGLDPTPRPHGPVVWLHAASVGETVSVLPVLSALAPDTTVLITTGTVTSAKLLTQALPKLGLADRVFHRFAPLDVPAWIARFLDHWRPDAAVFVESELWPNQLRACQARGIPLMLLNARLSESSFRTWRQVRGFARQTLGAFATIWARGEEDAARFRAIGAAQVETEGDLKFAAPPLTCDGPTLDRLRAEFAGRPLWVAASTHAGEEAAIVRLHGDLAACHPGLLTIIVPRHPDRGAALSAELRLPRWSAGAPPSEAGLWLGDTLGEMGLWYRLARVVFVGRSLLPPGGGQNPLEPARLGCAVAVGLHTGNFAEHVGLLREAQAIHAVSGPDELGAFVTAMLNDPAAASAMGKRAMSIAGRHGDLPGRAAAAILRLAAAGRA